MDGLILIMPTDIMATATVTTMGIITGTTIIIEIEITPEQVTVMVIEEHQQIEQ